MWRIPESLDWEFRRDREVFSQRLNKIAYHHGENAPFFWGRGNGWVAAGLAELLSEISEHHPHYASIFEGCHKMMNALRRYQADDGMWRQLIDKEEAWKETSCTAMFGYAITVGVNKGLLSPEEFTPVYQKAWNALVRYIVQAGKYPMHVSERARVKTSDTISRVP